MPKQDAQKSRRTGSNKPRVKRPTMAQRADRHVLYQESVQCVEAEIDFVSRAFRSLRGRKARLLREDFCGTANTSCEWVRRSPQNHALAVDLDADVLDWGRQHNVAQLPPNARRHIRLINQDVLKVKTDPVDIVLAMNFSYWCFKERPLLRRYFRRVLNSLVGDGILVLDAYGGYEAFRRLEEPHDYEDFTYVWDQAEYNPITGETTCHIHFRFPDGSKLKNAFSYHWRLWTLPELREILLEAGFAKATVYWDVGEDDEENFQPSEQGEPYAGWLCYLVAEK